MMRLRRGHTIIAAMALLATPAMATFGNDVADTYRGQCLMTETCRADDTCGSTPALGELLLEIDGADTWMGRDDASLRPIDRYPSLEAALPMPRVDIRRRSFLTDLPADGATRRFALRVQTRNPETGDPVLRGQYFVLRCRGF